MSEYVIQNSHVSLHSSLVEIVDNDPSKMVVTVEQDLHSINEISLQHEVTGGY